MIETLYPNGLVIRRDADLPQSSPRLLSSVPSLAEEGFDEIQASYLVLSTQASAQAVVIQHFPRGRQLAGHNMWVSRSSGRGIAPGAWVLDVTFRGMLSGTRYWRRVDAVVQQSGAENVSLTVEAGTGFSYPSTPIRLLVNEGMPTVRTSYVTTAAPDLTRVGRTATSGTLPGGYPALPPAPANRWTGIADPTYVYPAGWVLEARPSDSIRNESGAEVCWFVQDVHAYYHHVRP